MKLGIDIVGNIAILKFDRAVSLRAKKKVALDFLSEHKSVGTVLEKVGKFSGRLRTLKTRFLVGEKTKEVLYRENGCVFRFNVDTCYFSPRLSTERKKVASMVRRGEKVLVMFGGVAPFGIVIGKKLKKCAGGVESEKCAEGIVRLPTRGQGATRSKGKVVSVELGRECSKYALQNVKRNKLENVEIVQGDVRKKCPLLREKFDRIVMARPNLKDDFLDVAFPLVKKGGVIHYYGFYEIGKVGELKELVSKRVGEAGRKIRILKIEKAGDIGPYRFRWRVDFKVL